MSIKGRLILLSLLFILVISATCALTMVSLQSIRSEIGYSQDAGMIARNVFELNILTYQYLLHSEERMAVQRQIDAVTGQKTEYTVYEEFVGGIFPR